jgi:periplasmic divalent cation tolerance protein
MNSSYIIVFMTAKDYEEAQKISQFLLEKKLIACANIIKEISSFFWWEGKIDQASEAVIIAKSQRSLFPGIIEAVKKVHSYQVPEILAMPVLAGNPDYLSWIKESVKT